VYKKVDGRIELKEIGPRFELFRMFFFSVIVDVNVS